VGAGGPRLVNTGSWVLDETFLGERPRESPYWPGGAVVLDGEDPPRLEPLLPGWDPSDG
jgi:hypothetical protein